jgi:hypothetical protein
MELVIVFWLVCGAGAAMIASSKGRSGGAWLLAGLLFGPIAILIVGFMAPVTPPPDSTAPVTTPSSETVLYSEGKVRVTNQRLLVEERSFDIKKLQKVQVVDAGPNQWQINVKNLSGETVLTIEWHERDRMQRVADAINNGILAPVGVIAPAPPTDVRPNEPTRGSSETLAELRKMLDAGLITQEEYDNKKGDILANM